MALYCYVWKLVFDDIDVVTFTKKKYEGFWKVKILGQSKTLASLSMIRESPKKFTIFAKKLKIGCNKKF